MYKGNRSSSIMRAIKQSFFLGKILLEKKVCSVAITR